MRPVVSLAALGVQLDKVELARPESHKTARVTPVGKAVEKFVPHNDD